MSIFAWLHRRRMAAKHWKAEQAKLMAFKTPLNMRLLQVMHLDHAHRPTQGKWS